MSSLMIGKVSILIISHQMERKGVEALKKQVNSILMTLYMNEQIPERSQNRSCESNKPKLL